MTSDTTATSRLCPRACMHRCISNCVVVCVYVCCVCAPVILPSCLQNLRVEGWRAHCSRLDAMVQQGPVAGTAAAASTNPTLSAAVPVGPGGASASRMTRSAGPGGGASSGTQGSTGGRARAPTPLLAHAAEVKGGDDEDPLEAADALPSPDDSLPSSGGSGGPSSGRDGVDLFAPYSERI